MTVPDNSEETIIGDKICVENGTGFFKKNCFNNIFLLLFGTFHVMVSNQRKKGDSKRDHVTDSHIN